MFISPSRNKILDTRLWTDVSNKLQNKISPNSIFISIYHDRNNWKTELKIIYKNKGKTRKYNILKPHVWPVINDEFLLIFKLPCSFVYKRAKVCFEASQSSKFLTFEGKCKEETCGAILSGWSKEKPKEGEVLKISILTKNTIGKETQHT